jgi:hypothetical protein
MRIGVRIDGDGLDAESAQRADDAARYFTSISDQDFCKHEKIEVTARWNPDYPIDFRIFSKKIRSLEIDSVALIVWPFCAGRRAMKRPNLENGKQNTEYRIQNSEFRIQEFRSSGAG